MHSALTLHYWYRSVVWEKTLSLCNIMKVAGFKKKLPVSKALIHGNKHSMCCVSFLFCSDNVILYLLFRGNFPWQSVKIFITQRYQSGVTTQKVSAGLSGVTFYIALPPFPNGLKVEVLAYGNWPPVTIIATENCLLSPSGPASF